MIPERGCSKRRLALLALTATSAFTAIASAQTVPPIPTDPPPTGPQRPVPPALGSFARPDHPLYDSPKLSTVAPKLARGPIGLDDAVAVALTVSPVLAQAGQSLYGAQGRVGEARSAFVPTLSFSPGESYILQTAAPAYGVAATFPIDISHLLSTAVTQAKFQEIGARLDVNRVRNDIVYRVEAAFYDALRAKALVSVAKENLQDSLDRQYDAQARYAARAVAYIDVLRAQTDVANAQQRLIGAQSAERNALAVLANAMGIDVTEPPAITDRGAVAQPAGVAPPPSTEAPHSAAMPERTTGAADRLATETSQALALGPEFQTALSEARQNRPEILEADAGIAAARQGITLARRSTLPTLALTVGYYDLRTQSGSQVNEPQAFVGLTFPIFEGGLARSRVQEARATESNAVSTKREEVDAVTLDVQQTYLTLAQARDQVAVANQALAQARAGFDLARVRYNAGVASKAGVSPQLEVSDAQAALTLAEENQVNALYDYNAARARLDHATGRFAYVGNGTGFPAPPPTKALGVRNR